VGNSAASWDQDVLLAWGGGGGCVARYPVSWEVQAKLFSRSVSVAGAGCSGWGERSRAVVLESEVRFDSLLGSAWIWLGDGGFVRRLGRGFIGVGDGVLDGWVLSCGEGCGWCGL